MTGSKYPTMPVSAFPTMPVMSKSRDAGIQWYCAKLKLATSASGDAARFAAGLGL